MAKEYANMTLEELELENEKLMAQKEEIRALQLELQALMNEKKSQERLGALAAGLTDDEAVELASVLSQRIGAEGIESGEAVGTPGAD